VRSSDLLFTGSAVALGVIFALAGVGSCIPPHVAPLGEKRLELEQAEDQFCALRAKVRAAEIEAGVSVPPEVRP
jgi:hypothetical protein